MHTETNSRKTSEQSSNKRPTDSPENALPGSSEASLTPPAEDRGLPMGGSYQDVDAEGGSRSGSDLPSQRR